MIWLWLMAYAYSLFIPCANYLLNEFCDTDMRMDGYETQLRLAPARDIWDGLALASDLDADGIWFRQVIHGPCVSSMGSGRDIQRGLIITADVYLRTNMHHDYMTSLLHLHRIWVVSLSVMCGFTYLPLFMWYMIYLLIYEVLRLMLRYYWLYLLAISVGYIGWLYLLIMNCVV